MRSPTLNTLPTSGYKARRDNDDAKPRGAYWDLRFRGGVCLFGVQLAMPA